MRIILLIIMSVKLLRMHIHIRLLILRVRVVSYVARVSDPTARGSVHSVLEPGKQSSYCLQYYLREHLRIRISSFS